MAKNWRVAAAGALGLGLGLAGVWHLGARTEALRRHEIRKEVDLVTHQAAAHLRYVLEKHLVAERQLANFFENSATVTEEEFEDFASTTFDLTAGIVRLSVTDSSQRVRWVHPPEARSLLVRFDTRRHAEGHATIRRAVETRGAALSPPLRLLDGSQGFLLVLPILDGGAARGAVVAAFRSEGFFSATLVPEVLGRNDHRVVAAGVEIFSSGDVDSPADEDLAKAERFEFGGTPLEVRLGPRPEVVRAALGSGRTAFWALGSLLSLCAGVAAGAATWKVDHLSRRAESRTQALEETRQKLDDAMQQLLQAEKIAALGELVAGVAHEMNHPLCSIMGHTQRLLSTERSAEERSRLETVFSEAGRMAKIVRNLLSFARKQPPEKKYLGASTASSRRPWSSRRTTSAPTRSAWRRISIRTCRRRCSTSTRCSRCSSTRSTTPSRRWPPAAGAGTCACAPAGGGIGSSSRSPTTAPESLRRSSTASSSRSSAPRRRGRARGWGSRCATATSRSTAAGSACGAARAGGATFVVDLPVVEGGEQAADAAPAGRALAAPRLRVLIIDDEQGVQNFLADVLGSRGHRIDSASDVPEAVRKIQEGDYNAILSDVEMPGGSGGDVLEAARRRSPELARRIVFMTGDEASDDTRRFLGRVGNVSVSKPFRLEQSRPRSRGRRAASPPPPAPCRVGASSPSPGSNAG